MVESVVPRSAGARAGLQPGDVLVSWSAAAAPPAFPRPADGGLRLPYDLLPLEIEQAPRRAVTLRGRRGPAQTAWILRSGDWGLLARPALPADLAERHREGRARAGAGDTAGAERSWRAAAGAARAGGDSRLAGWLLNRLAGALADAGRWPRADAAYGEAVAALERARDPAATAELLRVWGETFRRRGAWAEAMARYRKALVLDPPRSLAAARTLNALATTFTRKGDYPAAERLLRQAMALGEELAPAGEETAESLRLLGHLARLRSDLPEAEAYLLRGEEIQRRLAPDGTGHARLLLGLGSLAQKQGDLGRAERLYRRALSILEATAPAGEDMASCLLSLASLAVHRSDLAAGGDLLRRIEALAARRAPDRLDRSRALLYQGHFALDRGDLDGAAMHYRRALAIALRIAPESREAAAGLSALGSLVLHRGDPTGRAHLYRALAIEEKLEPGSLDVAMSLENLSQREPDLAKAEDLLRRALAIYERKAPGSQETSVILRNLGHLLAHRGRPLEALPLHRQALAIQRKLVPGSLMEVSTTHFLGLAERWAGRHRDGVRDLCRAVDLVDAQRARLGGAPEANVSFEHTLSDFYHSCIQGLLDLGRSAEAFHVVERGRARAFLALLAERDLRLADLPPGLAAERRHLHAEYDRVQAQLAAAGADSAEAERLTTALHALRARQEEILARIRQESPRAADLEDPQPLDLAGARAALDPGTVLLEYAVGPEKSALFVVRPAGAAGPGLAVVRLDRKWEDLRGEVERFRLLLRDPGSDEGKLAAEARRLYGLLVGPAEAYLQGAQRILVAPDGPLHTLPFAALRRGDGYLVEWKPVHSVLSATVYAELAAARPDRREPGQERLVAFGDPVFRPAARHLRADPVLREAHRRGLALKRLRWSGREVRSIAALFPGAQVYLGRQATEERAKSLGPEARLLHFACHGLLDERFPLNSALALTLPEQLAAGRDNGLLQAWEIFEGLHLDADLVTLSACDTALGPEMAGEGLIGLTRAFQYAGARSVLATLWAVADRSTARLMPRFYAHLRAGRPKDEALQAAQLDQLREAATTHPFHWAAFQLTGDWR